MQDIYTHMCAFVDILHVLIDILYVFVDICYGYLACVYRHLARSKLVPSYVDFEQRPERYKCSIDSHGTERELKGK